MDSKLENLYTQIEQDGVHALRNHHEQLDDNLHNLESDSRKGLTLLVHLPAHVTRNINFALNELKLQEPFQYYYQSPTIHITIMDLRRATADFHLTETEKNQYQQVIGEIVKHIKPINWHLAGLICSPGAVLVKGFYSPELTQLRDELRTNLSRNGLILDERYETFSGHATVVRFQRQLKHPRSFLNEVMKMNNIAFGDFYTNNIDLVIHDWYNRHSQLLERFTLKTS